MSSSRCLTPLAVLGVIVGIALSGIAAGPGPLAPAELGITAALSADVNTRLSVALSDIQDITITEDADHRLRAAVRLAGRPVNLELRRHSLRDADFQVLVQSEVNGPLVPVEPPPVRTYRGAVAEIPGTEVRGTYIDGQFTGVIYTPDGVYGIQPLTGLGLEQPQARHAVYLQDDSLGAGDFFCGTDVSKLPEISGGGSAAERSAAGTGLEVADLGLDADFDYFQLLGSVNNTVIDMESIINSVEPVYEVSPLDLTFEITTVIVRTVAGAPYTSSDPDTLLQQFENNWNTSPESNIQRDVAHLFTGKELIGPPVGIASVGTVCNTFNAYGLSQSRWTFNFTFRKTVTAHELGHNFGAGHCDAFPTCRIMCSGVGGCDGLVPFSFGANEVAQLNPFIDSRTCLAALGLPQTLPFCEDWPSSVIDIDKWSYVKNGSVTQIGVNEPSAPWSLNLDTAGAADYQDDEIRSNYIQLVGESGVVFTYRTEHRGVEAGEQLVVEYFNNNQRWSEINRVTSTGVDQNNYVFHSHVLPANAYHNEFRIRFRPEVDSTSDDWYIDDISLDCPLFDCDDPCSDNDVCTTGDVCNGQVCVGEAVDCSAMGDDCNIASCDINGSEGNCDLLATGNEGGPCNGGLGVCASGSCVETRVFMAAAGQEGGAETFGPTSLVMAAGQTATVEVWIARTTPRELGAFQVALPGVATPSGGATGTVTYVDTAGTGGSVVIDTSDSDWVFSIDGSVVPAYSETGLPDGFAMLAALPLGNGVLVSDMAYLGEFQLAASGDALGTFTLAFLPLNAPPNGGTALADDTQVSQILSSLQPLEITVVQGGDCFGDAADCADLDTNGIRDDGCIWWDCIVPACVSTDIIFADMGGSFGTCPPDDFVNLFDRNHALTCFAGTNVCDPINIDAGGSFGSCTPDGFCNLFDANHALTAFAGTNPCTCPSNPSPAQAVRTAGAAALALSAESAQIRPGSTVAVRVFVDGTLENLQGYQLHAAASGGSSGRLELVDIVVEPRKDAAFATTQSKANSAGSAAHGRASSAGHGGAPGAAAVFEAFNVGAGQMLAGLEDGGVPTAHKAYLATFIYQASPDASGAFVVDLLHDEARGDQTFLVADFTGRIDVITTRPAVIIVGAAAERTANR